MKGNYSGLDYVLPQNKVWWDPNPHPHTYECDLI